MSKKTYLFIVFSGLFVLLLVIGLNVFNYINKGINKDKKLNTVEKCDRCNIILIDIDILRADALPCYGYNRNTAPNICALAKNSLLFKDNYSTSNYTLPSIFSTITSLPQIFHRVRLAYANKLDPKTVTMAETLKNNGYITVFINIKGYPPAVMGEENGGIKGYDIVTTKPAEEVMDELSKSTQPWFIHYYRGDLHLPYLLKDGEKPIENITPPKNFPTTESQFAMKINIYLKKNYTRVFNKKAIDEFGSIIFAPEKGDDTSVTELVNKIILENRERTYLLENWGSNLYVYLDSFDKNNKSDVNYVRMMYDTKISLLDKELAPLFSKLMKDYQDNTITIVMSDHGEAFGEHGMFSHEDDYHSEMFYTPLIIKVPQNKNYEIEQTTSNMDIFPTLMDLINIRIPDGLQGESLIPYITSKKNNRERFVFGSDSKGIILQNKKWLYYMPNNIYTSSDSILYDKTKDPKETKNIASKYPKIVKTLYKQANILRQYDVTITKTEKTPDYKEIKIDSRKLERMKKEGYF